MQLSRGIKLRQQARLSTSARPVLAVRAIAAPAETLDEAAVLRDVKVTVFSSQQYVKDFLSKPLASIFPSTDWIEARLDQGTARLAEGSTAVVAFVNDDLSGPVVEELHRVGVRLIAMRCAGYDRVDLATVHRLGMKVTRVPTYSPSSVAEHAVALMFALNRNLHAAYVRTLQGNYSLNGLVGFEMRGKIAGVVGTGAIGTEACRILKGLGCKVLAYDLYPSARVTEMGVEYVDLPELLMHSDIVSLHCPLLPSTRHLINRERLSQMKCGAMLVNVSRGGLVESDALLDALEFGQLGALGMDVYENEGDIFFQDYTQFDTSSRMKHWDRRFKSLLTYPQLLEGSGQVGFTLSSQMLYMRQALAAIAETTIENIANFAQGKPLGANEVIYKVPT